MIYAIIFLSIIFLGTGFAINKNNAGYLLAGYNTMSPEDKAKMDIASYLKTFKRFHIFLGISFLVLGLFFLYVFGEDYAGLFLAIYPILAYAGWLIRGRFYFKSPLRKLAIGMLFFSLLIIVVLFWSGQKQTKIIFYENEVKLTGIYGEKIKKSNFQALELLNELPPLKMRVNGFSLSIIKKGIFKMSNQEKVKLFIHSDKEPIIRVLKSDGKQLFFNDKEGKTVEIFNELKKWSNQ